MAGGGEDEEMAYANIIEELRQEMEDLAARSAVEAQELHDLVSQSLRVMQNRFVRLHAAALRGAIRPHAHQLPFPIPSRLTLQQVDQINKEFHAYRAQRGGAQQQLRQPPRPPQVKVPPTVTVARRANRPPMKASRPAGADIPLPATITEIVYEDDGDDGVTHDDDDDGGERCVEDDGDDEAQVTTDTEQEMASSREETGQNGSPMSETGLHLSHGLDNDDGDAEMFSPARSVTSSPRPPPAATGVNGDDDNTTEATNGAAVPAAQNNRIGFDEAFRDGDIPAAAVLRELAPSGRAWVSGPDQDLKYRADQRIKSTNTTLSLPARRQWQDDGKLHFLECKSDCDAVGEASRRCGSRNLTIEHFRHMWELRRKRDASPEGRHKRSNPLLPAPPYSYRSQREPQNAVREAKIAILFPEDNFPASAAAHSGPGQGGQVQPLADDPEAPAVQQPGDDDAAVPPSAEQLPQVDPAQQPLPDDDDDEDERV